MVWDPQGDEQAYPEEECEGCGEWVEFQVLVHIDVGFGALCFQVLKDGLECL